MKRTIPTWRPVHMSINPALIAEVDKWREVPRSRLVTQLLTEWLVAEKKRQASHEGV
jgi:hypothetical protein